MTPSKETSAASSVPDPDADPVNANDEAGAMGPTVPCSGADVPMASLLRPGGTVTFSIKPNGLCTEEL